MGPIDWVAFILVIIGGLNWGLVAFSSNYNLVDGLFGTGSVLSRIVYGLVGLSALVMIVMAFMNRKHESVSSEI